MKALIGIALCATSQAYAQTDHVDADDVETVETIDAPKTKEQLRLKIKRPRIVKHPECIHNPNDPYDWGFVFPGGLMSPFKGKCVDSSFRRSLYVLPPNEAAAYNPKPGEIVMANYYSDGKYWVIKANVDRIADVQLTTEDFGHTAGFIAHPAWKHVFEKDSPATLYPQDTSLPKQEQKVEEVIFSAEPTGMRGDHLNFVRAVTKQYVMAYRGVSEEEIAHKAVGIKKRPVFQTATNLKPADRKSMFLNSAVEATQAGMNRYYNSIWRNCATVAMGTARKSLDRGIAGKLLARSLSFITIVPGLYRHVLKFQGRVDDKRKVQTLNYEAYKRGLVSDETLKKTGEDKLVALEDTAKYSNELPAIIEVIGFDGMSKPPLERDLVLPLPEFYPLQR